jgi:penicillin V acylase-like amidase (Ntn superfamily)
VKNRLPFALVLGAAVTSLLDYSVGHACTGITLRAADGAVIQGRTMEWGSFDIKSRVVIIPRGYTFTSHTPDGKSGMTWKTKYGVVGLDAIDKDIVVDGMNETGLTLGVFYHPGFADYQQYDPAQAAESMGPTDVGQYLLSTCATVDDVRTAIKRVHVVAVIEPALGFAAPVHFLATEPSGKAVVIEYLKGELCMNCSGFSTTLTCRSGPPKGRKKMQPKDYAAPRPGRAVMIRKTRSCTTILNTIAGSE